MRWHDAAGFVGGVSVWGICDLVFHLSWVESLPVVIVVCLGVNGIVHLVRRGRGRSGDDTSD